jgi:hypothetical protein
MLEEDNHNIWWGTGIDIKELPFGNTDWSEVTYTIHNGETGMDYWRTKNFEKHL